jgi:hypothetical protein
MKTLFFAAIILVSSTCFSQKLYWTSEFGGQHSNGAIISYDFGLSEISTTVTLEGNPLYADNPVFDLSGGNQHLSAGLIKGTDGNYYGINMFGTGSRLNSQPSGISEFGGRGFFYRYNPQDLTIEILHSFVGNQEWSSDNYLQSSCYKNDVSVPIYSVLEYSPGVFYGIAKEGGVSGKGGIWKYDLNTGIYSVIGSFNNSGNNVGFNPVTALIKGDTNHIYGLNKDMEGANSAGILYKVNTQTDQLEIVSDIQSSGLFLEDPIGQLTYDSLSNIIYGTKDQFDNLNNWGGGVWSYNLSNSTQNTVWSIDNSQLVTLGNNTTGIVHANDGFIYVTTRNGGANGTGTIIKYSPSAGTYVKVLDFPAGFAGISGMGMINIDSKIYGTCKYSINGTLIWSFDIGSNTYTSMINGNTSNPNHPGNKIEYGILHDNGKIIGKTKAESSHGAGSIFEVDISNGQNNILMDCGSRSGRFIIGELVRYNDSIVIGYIGKGGPTIASDTSEYCENGALAMFNLKSGQIDYIDNPFGTFGTGFPEVQTQWMNNSLVASNGKLYYTKYSATENSVSYDIMESDLNSAAISIISYDNNGLISTPGIVEISGGRFIMSIDNIIYEYDFVNSNLINIHSNTHNVGKFGHMNNNQIVASNGRIYGMTTPSTLGDGPETNLGVIYSLDPNTFEFTVEYMFDSLIRSTNGGLTELNGKLYGSTNFLGANNHGFLFSFDLNSGVFTTEHNFNIETDGVDFNARWTAYNERLYSTSRAGGAYGNGTLVMYNPFNSSFNVLFSLKSTTGRSFRGTPLLIDPTAELNSIETSPLKLFPNPNNGVFTIEGIKIKSIDILSVDGKLISFDRLGNDISLKQNTPGIYFAKVLGEDGVVYSLKMILE